MNRAYKNNFTKLVSLFVCLSIIMGNFYVQTDAASISPEFYRYTEARQTKAIQNSLHGILNEVNGFKQKTGTVALKVEATPIAPTAEPKLTMTNSSAATKTNYTIYGTTEDMAKALVASQLSVTPSNNGGNGTLPPVVVEPPTGGGEKSETAILVSAIKKAVNWSPTFNITEMQSKQVLYYDFFADKGAAPAKSYAEIVAAMNKKDQTEFLIDSEVSNFYNDKTDAGRSNLLKFAEAYEESFGLVYGEGPADKQTGRIIDGKWDAFKSGIGGIYSGNVSFSGLKFLGLTLGYSFDNVRNLVLFGTDYLTRDQVNKAYTTGTAQSIARTKFTNPYAPDTVRAPGDYSDRYFILNPHLVPKAYNFFKTQTGVDVSSNSSNINSAATKESGIIRLPMTLGVLRKTMVDSHKFDELTKNGDSNLDKFSQSMIASAKTGIKLVFQETGLRPWDAENTFISLAKGVGNLGTITEAKTQYNRVFTDINKSKLIGTNGKMSTNNKDVQKLWESALIITDLPTEYTWGFGAMMRVSADGTILYTSVPLAPACLSETDLFAYQVYVDKINKIAEKETSDVGYLDGNGNGVQDASEPTEEVRGVLSSFVIGGSPGPRNPRVIGDYSTSAIIHADDAVILGVTHLDKADGKPLYELLDSDKRHVVTELSISEDSSSTHMSVSTGTDIRGALLNVIWRPTAPGGRIRVTTGVLEEGTPDISYQRRVWEELLKLAKAHKASGSIPAESTINEAGTDTDKTTIHSMYLLFLIGDYETKTGSLTKTGTKSAAEVKITSLGASITAFLDRFITQAEYMTTNLGSGPSINLDGVSYKAQYADFSESYFLNNIAVSSYTNVDNNTPDLYLMNPKVVYSDASDTLTATFAYGTLLNNVPLEHYKDGSFELEMKVLVGSNVVSKEIKVFTEADYLRFTDPARPATFTLDNFTPLAGETITFEAVINKSKAIIEPNYLNNIVSATTTVADNIDFSIRAKNSVISVPRGTAGTTMDVYVALDGAPTKNTVVTLFNNANGASITTRNVTVTNTGALLATFPVNTAAVATYDYRVVVNTNYAKTVASPVNETNLANNGVDVHVEVYENRPGLTDACNSNDGVRYATNPVAVGTSTYTHDHTTTSSGWVTYFIAGVPQPPVWESTTSTVSVTHTVVNSNSAVWSLAQREMRSNINVNFSNIRLESNNWSNDGNGQKYGVQKTLPNAYKIGGAAAVADAYIRKALGINTYKQVIRAGDPLRISGNVVITGQIEEEEVNNSGANSRAALEARVNAFADDIVTQMYVEGQGGAKNNQLKTQQDILVALAGRTMSSNFTERTAGNTSTVSGNSPHAGDNNGPVTGTKVDIHRLTFTVTVPIRMSVAAGYIDVLNTSKRQSVPRTEDWYTNINDINNVYSLKLITQPKFDTLGGSFVTAANATRRSCSIGAGGTSSSYTNNDLRFGIFQTIYDKIK